MQDFERRQAQSMASPTAIVGASVEVLEAQIARLLDRMKLAVVFGGQKRDPAAVINPTINPRSRKSYESVAQDIADSLRRIGFRHAELVPDDMRLGDRLRNAAMHLACLNTRGVQGHNPPCHAPAGLQTLAVPPPGAATW